MTIEGAPPPELVDACRAGDAADEYQLDELHCNALVAIDDGELPPTHTAEDGTPIWSYSESELRELARE